MLHVCKPFFLTTTIGVSGGPRVGVVGTMGGANVAGGMARGGYDLDEFSDESVIQESLDFAYVVRSKLASEHKQKSRVSGFEVRVVPGCLVKQRTCVFCPRYLSSEHSRGSVHH